MSTRTRNFPYVTDYLDELLHKEKERFNYRFIRPLLTLSHFFLRIVLVPLKFLFHRWDTRFDGSGAPAKRIRRTDDQTAFG
jgi:hypothetical protein